jgi:5-(carboxyamino)imidazole ribonucleotide mutase
MSNALGGVIGSNSKYPAINCPPFKNELDMQINIWSSIQCPSNVPVLTILSPSNCALAVKKILDL